MDNPAILAIAPVVGAVVGSFLALVADRWPRGEDVVAAPSRCRGCHRPLGLRQLVPVFSYLVQRGRCAWCGIALPIDLLLGELAGALVAGLALWHADAPWQAAALAGFGWALVLLALLDARHLWLPDAITLPLLLAGLISAWANDDLPARALGAAIGWAALEAVRQLYRRLRHREGLGGGDPKLFGAIGAWLGLSALPPILLAAALLGLAWAAVAGRGKPDTQPMKLPLGTLLAIAAIGYLAI